MNLQLSFLYFIWCKHVHTLCYGYITRKPNSGVFINLIFTWLKVVRWHSILEWAQTTSSHLKIRLGTVYLFIRACMGYYDRIQELTYLNFGSIMGNKLTKLTWSQCVHYKCTICFFVSVNFWLISVSFTWGQSLFYPAIIVPHKPVYNTLCCLGFWCMGYRCLTCHCLLLFQLVSSGTYTQPLKVQSAGKNAGSITVSMKMVLCTFCH